MEVSEAESSQQRQQQGSSLDAVESDGNEDVIEEDTEVEGSEETGATKKRKRKRESESKKGPFDTEDVFQATNPFLVEKEWIPEHCRFGEERSLDPEVLAIILDVALGNYVSAERSFKSTGSEGELANHIKLAALLSDIKDFTKLSDPEGRVTKRRKVSECEGMKIRTPGTDENDDDDENEDFHPTNESQPNEHEHEHDTKEEAAEFWIYVKDFRPRKLKKRELAHLSDPWRLTVVVDANDKKDKRAVLEAVSKSAAEIRRNFKNGHVDPVYVLVVTEDHWTYAMLDIAGVVTVADEVVTRASYKSYKSTAKLHFARILQEKISDDNKLLISKQDMDAQLADVIKLYYRPQRTKDDAYPDGEYLVGTLHTAEKWYLLPDSNLVGGLVHEGCRMFYEGLSRCVVGDRVRRWKAQDALEACESRGRVNAELKRYAGLAPHPRLAPAYKLVDQMTEEEKTQFFDLVGKMEARMGFKW